jgi:hypothetical protein
MHGMLFVVANTKSMDIINVYRKNAFYAADNTVLRRYS